MISSVYEGKSEEFGQAFLEAEFWGGVFGRNCDIFPLFFRRLRKKFRGILGLADFVKMFIQNIAVDWLSHL